MYYDWIYLSALHREKGLADEVMAFDGFTNIEFNPKKSFNCQARSVALYVALRRHGILERLLQDADHYQKHMLSIEESRIDCGQVQSRLL